MTPPHPLTNFKIQEYYQNEPRFNGVFSRDNLPNNINNNNNNNNNNNIRSKGLDSAVKNGAYVINLGEYRDIGTHWVALNVNRVEHITKEIMKFIGNKNIITNIFRMQGYDSIMCGYFYMGFINFMFNGNSLTDYTSLFSPNDLKKTMI